MSQIPAGKTFFTTVNKSFVDVPITPDGIATSEFLEAAESLTTLFDHLGSVAFTPVKKDMNGNITKVRARQLAAPGESGTLQLLVKNELATKSSTATEGLLWLVRGLDFTAQALRADITSNSGLSLAEQKPNAELAESFRAAYKNTLAPHHGFLVKPIFSAAMSATPYRKDFTAKLVGAGVSQEQAQADFETWVSALEERVDVLKKFLTSLDKKWKP